MKNCNFFKILSLTIILILCSSNKILAQSIYNNSGNAICSVQGGSFYSNGQRIGSVEKGVIYSGGNKLGTIQGNTLYNNSGNAICFVQNGSFYNNGQRIGFVQSGVVYDGSGNRIASSQGLSVIEIAIFYFYLN